MLSIIFSHILFVWVWFLLRFIDTDIACLEWIRGDSEYKLQKLTNHSLVRQRFCITRARNQIRNSFEFWRVMCKINIYAFFSFAVLFVYFQLKKFCLIKTFLFCLYCFSYPNLYCDYALLLNQAKIHSIRQLIL
jgi:hypothetical protein